MPPKFFITHSWKDIEFTRRLFADLKEQGFEVWFDDATLKAGHRMAEEINRGLAWCDYYLPIISRAALESKWCAEEVNAAISLSVESDGFKPRIVSILVENCRDELKARFPSLAARLYINFSADYQSAFSELLAKSFGAEPKPIAADPPKVKPAPQPQQKIVVPPAPQIITPPPPEKIVTPARSIIHPKTGKEMLLISAGEFVMGEGNAARQVFVDAFYISRYPVTNAEYKKFVDATKYRKPEHWQSGKIPAGKENLPVTNVTWYCAVAYCKWAGARLPTETEWEKAASWDEPRKAKRVYPWGDNFDANKCNTSESKIGDTTPVDKYSPQGDSAYGVVDMAGNVWEWCADWYDSKQNYRVLRGGSWNLSNVNARCAFRCYDDPGSRDFYVGFRVAESFPT